MRGQRFPTTLATEPSPVPQGAAGDGADPRRTGTNYAPILIQFQPTHPAANPPSRPAAAPSAQPPVLSLVDAGILTVRDRLARPRNEEHGLAVHGG